ncbi:MAG TPA: PBP1A family penicillin-binding protein [Xanthobacteraceae bacterium]|jgi:penicillin-binding protein 1A|nr:PBP1A family penicillin-binding protein [Xanthobacteraceae bacterium]
MAWQGAGRKRARNPARLELRLRPQDRTGGPPSGRDNGHRRRRDDFAPREVRKRRRSGGRRSALGSMFYWGAVLAVWAIIAAIGLVIWIGAHLPPIQSLEIPKRPPSVLIVGAGGTTLATRGDMGGAAVMLRELPDYVPKAFIAIEDRRFYWHHGVDPLGILRALMHDVLRRGNAQGGSTITQQLAKNLFLTQERTVSRKLQEVALAFWLEHRFNKSQILELYLNRVYFGSGAYGVEAATQRYFGKSARQMTVAEAALLAGLVQSPSRLAPSHNPDGAERRARVVLADMADQNLIGEDAEKLALAHPARAVKPAGADSLNYVADWVMDAVNDYVGRFDQDIVVETSIDPALQGAAEHALDDALREKGEKFGISEGAIVAMTPDGIVRALVGGRSYAESQFNRAIAAKRQPGSAFKPFVYLTALEHGLTPETVRDDAPITVKGWKPENYEHEFMGPVTLTTALANSLNTVSVRLILEVGPSAVARTAYRLGIDSKLDPNPSLALGTSGVSPLELVSAYAPFANGGFAAVPHVIERIKGTDGSILYARATQALGRIVDARYVAMMNSMLHETIASGTGRHADLPGWPAAGKTGTSQDYRDAWFVGYTSHMVTGIWLGNDDNSPTRKAVGGGLPVDVWSRFMRAAHQGVAPSALPGAGGGSPITSLFQSAAAPPAGGRAPQSNQEGLDSWLLDKLFGRH